MTKVCIVCGNRASETDREIVDPLQKITYHKIPISGERNKKWLAFCGLSKKDNINNKFVCSEHFERKHLERDLKSELLDGVKRMILSKDANPTIKKPKKQKRKASQEHEEEQRKKRKEEVEKLLRGDTPEPILNPFRQKNVDPKQKPSLNTAEPSAAVNSSRKKNKVQFIEYPMEVEAPAPKTGLIATLLEQENKALKHKILELEQLMEKKNEKIKLAKTEMLNITIALQELKDIENRNLNIRVKELLKGTFTDNQIRKLMCSNDNVTWTNEEMMNAFVLRMMGVETYDFVYRLLQYPLPGVYEMEKWIQNCYLQTGLLIPVLSVLKALGRKMEARDKECVLLLGRTKANPKYSYDSARDQIIDNNGYLYCICVQGILSKWHQLIYIDFDLIYSADLLMALVNELYDINFNVIAISGMCDQETADLWNEFDVSPENNFIQHPKTDEPIYMFGCTISTITVIHKVMVDDGFLVQDDVVVSRDVIEKLFDSNHPGIHQHLHITKRHLSHDISSESDNRLSEELISHSTARALKILSEEGEEAVAVLGTLIELFRDWYDLFTTPSVKQNIDVNKSITHQQYGVSIDEQNIVLDGMYDTIESLRCTNDQHNYLLEVILVSINSLRQLYLSLRKKHHNESIATINLTSFGLNGIFSNFQNIHDRSLASINKILFQLSVAIADSDPLSMTNVIVEKSGLSTCVRTYEKPDSPQDKHTEHISENEACSFLAGYVANKLKEKYDYLGDQTFVIERKNNSYVVMPEMPTGIIEPSRLWMEQARKLEAYVSDITFYRNESVIENVVSSISKRHPKMGVDIIRLYVETRIMIKLNNLNKELENMC